MEPDLLDLYGKASAWTCDKIRNASDQLDAETPNDGWDVRMLLNHMLETQHYFLASGRGQDASPPSPTPPTNLLSDDPGQDFEQVREEMLRAYREPGVAEKTGPSLGIAFSDMLLHGWDVARATGQDTTMPAGLPDAAYSTIHGRFTDEQRKGVFKPEIPVPADAPAQAKLLAYTGRRPD